MVGYYSHSRKIGKSLVTIWMWIPSNNPTPFPKSNPSLLDSVFPHFFGQVCATHSINTVYSKGARPVYALNIPYCAKEVPQEVYEGASSLLNRAGVNMAGTEEREDVEPR